MEELTRTTYRDPSSDVERDGSTARRESLVDHEHYQRPLERAHGSALHPSGIAAGLEIRASTGRGGLRVLPGVALTASGDHIVLAEGGYALVGATGPVPVTLDGATVPTGGPDGSHLLTIARAETFDRRTFEESGRKTFQTDHTPRLRLRPEAEVTPELLLDEVGLATVTLAAGLVTALDAETRDQHERLTLRRPARSSDGTGLTVGSATAGELVAGAESLTLYGTRSVVELGDGQIELSTRQLPEGRITALSIGEGHVSVTGTLAASGTLSAPGLRVGETSDDSGAGPGHLLVGTAIHVGPPVPLDDDAALVVGRGAIMPAIGDGPDTGITFPRDARRGGGEIHYTDRGASSTLTLTISGAADSIAFERAGTEQLALRDTGTFVSGMLSAGPLEVSGHATVSGRLGVGGAGARVALEATTGALLGGVSVGEGPAAAADPEPMGYPHGHETIGVARRDMDLRLQSPNAIFLHTHDPATDSYRERIAVRTGNGGSAQLTVGPGTDAWLMTRHVVGKHYANDTNDGLFLNWNTGQPVQVGSVGVPAALSVFGGVAVSGDMALAGKHALRGNDAWLRLNQDGAFTNGVHTPRMLSSGGLNVGGVDNWADPGPGNVAVSGTVRAGGDIVARGNLSWSGDSAGRHFIRLGGLQICWGYGAFANRGYQENQHDFPAAFAEAPAVTVTLNDTGAGVSDPHAAVGAWGRDGRETPDAGGFTASFKNNRQTDHTVHYSWIAVGRAG